MIKTMCNAVQMISYKGGAWKEANQAKAFDQAPTAMMKPPQAVQNPKP